MEEKVVFERAFHMHGKHFHRIKAFVSNLFVTSTIYTVYVVYLVVILIWWFGEFCKDC